MKMFIKRIIALSLASAIALISILAYSEKAYAKDDSKKYSKFIYDAADVITEEQEGWLLEELNELTVYGNVGVITVNVNQRPYYSREYAYSIYKRLFDSEPTTILVMDIFNDYIYIFNKGQFKKVISANRDKEIKKRVGVYFDDRTYFYAAESFIDQELQYMQNSEDAGYIKYVSYALLAIIIAMLVNYLIIRQYSKRNEITETDQISSIVYVRDITDYKEIRI